MLAFVTYGFVHAEEVDDQLEISKFRMAMVWLLPIAVTIIWVIYVLTFGHFDRVVANWRASTTMVFGGFVAGSTPQGGGAVAFPVFTKLIGITSPVARSFSIGVQSSGMVMASLGIIIAGRKVEWKALRIGVSGGIVGFIIGLFVFGDRSTPFWESRIPSDFVKVAFTIVIFAVAIIVRQVAKKGATAESVEHWTMRATGSMIAFSIFGGFFSSMAGSGTDVFLFVFLVLIAGVCPKVAIPTSVVAMASVSLFGFAILGFWHGQLDIGLSADATEVISVNGAAFGPQPAVQFDLFGIWLAAAPVVAWMAPVGAYVVTKVSEKVVIYFVAFMSTLELLSTALFLDTLRTNVTLLIFFISGLIGAYFFVMSLGMMSEVLMPEDEEDDEAEGVSLT